MYGAKLPMLVETGQKGSVKEYVTFLARIKRLCVKTDALWDVTPLGLVDCYQLLEFTF